MIIRERVKRVVVCEFAINTAAAEVSLYVNITECILVTRFYVENLPTQVHILAGWLALT